MDDEDPLELAANVHLVSTAIEVAIKTLEHILDGTAKDDLVAVPVDVIRDTIGVIQVQNDFMKRLYETVSTLLDEIEKL